MKQRFTIERIPDAGLPYREAIKAKAFLEHLADGSYLVPDDTMQAIADAWKRWRYLQARSLNLEVQEARWKAEILLDALVEREQP